VLGLPSPIAKGICLINPNYWETNKMLSDSGVEALKKVVEVYMGEADWPAKPT
jgi:hypothetical protein